jgi:ABC-type polysaccharide/polyol phosphate export permease
MRGNTQFNAAIADIAGGLRYAPLWWRMSVEATVTRYRRALLGPFWLATSTLAIAVGLTLVFGVLLGGDWRTSFPFVLSGLMCWALVGGAIGTGAGVFLGSGGLMQVRPFPLSFHVLHHLAKISIDFAHQIVAFWVVMAVVRLFPLPHWHLLLALPLVFVTNFFLIIPIGMISTRYRDVNYFVSFIMGVAFLLTPVFWRRASLPESRYWIVDLNPLSHMLEILRQPLLGHPASLHHWTGVLITLAIGSVVTVLSLMVHRRRVVFWL